MKCLLIFFLLILAAIKTEAQFPKLTLPERHSEHLISAAFINDDKKVITSASDNTIKIWSADRGTFISELNDFRAPLQTVIVSKDQKKILTKLWNGIFQVWSADSLAEICYLKNNRAEYKNNKIKISPLIFSEQGDKILLVTPANNVQIFSSEDGSLLTELNGIKDDIYQAVFSPDGTKIIIVTRNYEATVWATGTGKKLFVLNKSIDPVSQAIFSLDGNVIFVSNGSAINILSAENGYNLNRFDQMPYDVLNISVSNDKLVATYGDRMIRAWNVFTGSLIFEVESGLEILYKATLSNDGKALVAISADDKYEILSAETGELLSDGKNKYGFHLNDPVISRDRTKLIAIDLYTAYIISVENATVLASVEGQVAGIEFADLSFDEKKMVTFSNDYHRDICIWSTETGELLTKLAKDATIENKFIDRDLIFSPDNKTMLGRMDSLLLIWNVNNGRLVACPIHNKIIEKCSFSADSKTILTICADKSIWVWSTEGKLLFTHTFQWNNNFPSITPDSKYVIAASTYFEIKVWSIADGSLLQTLTFNKSIRRISISPNGELLLVVHGSGDLTLWSIKEGTLTNNLLHRKIIDAEFTADSKKIIPTSANKRSKIYSTDSNKLLGVLRHTIRASNIMLSPDGKNALFTGKSGFEFWSLNSFKRIFIKKSINMSLSAISFINKGKEILVKTYTTTYFNGQAGGYILSAEDGRLLRELYFYKGSTGCLNIEGGKYLLVGNTHNVTLVKLSNGQPICTFNYISEGGYLTQLSSGYYRCSRNTSKLVNFVNDKLETITFDQLDVRYNRPDIVMQELGSADTTLMYAYRHAYYKRMSKLGMDTSNFRGKYSFPTCDITNKDLIKYQQKSKTLKIHLKLSDSSYSLDRINVWINNVPIFGSKGISIRWRNSNSYDTTMAIILSVGENKIETSVLNVNGIESYRIPLFVNYAFDKRTINMAIE